MSDNYKMTGYEYSRQWWDFAFENPEMVTGNHAGLYLWNVELNNRMGWARKFASPVSQAMSAVGIKSYKTYKKIFDDLVSWGFFEVIQLTKNQSTATIIALVKFTEATTKALDKAITKASPKQLPKQLPKQVQSNSTINKQVNNETNKPTNDEIEIVDENIFLNYEEAESRLLDSGEAIESTCIHYKISADQYRKYVNTFILEKKSEEHRWQRRDNPKKHFQSWLRIRITSEQRIQVAEHPNAYRRDKMVY